MSLTTLTYLIFLIVCVCAYHLLPKQTKNISLLLFSVLFYSYAMPEQLLITMAYVWVIFFLGIAVYKKRRKPNVKKLLFISGILISVGFLFFYKYLNFSISLFTREPKTFSLIVPMGISYITFQCIAYMMEVYKGRMKAVDNPVSFFLYALLFMKVTAGPIEPPRKFLKSLKESLTVKWEDILKSMILIAMGFVKKMVIADSLAPYVADVFDSPAGKDGLTVFIAMFMYSMQIYFDFSGYTDIARGSAGLFGISLTENFRHPYLAKSVREFWRRWHISLSNWLKKYIYFTLGGSRVGTVRRYLNVIIVFLVSGIWHGASFTYIIWGLLHGIYQVIEIAFAPAMVKCRAVLHIKENGRLHTHLDRIRTFIMVTVAWVFFRAGSLENAFLIFKRLFSPWKSFGVVSSDFMPETKLLILIFIAFLFVWVAEILRMRVAGLNAKTVVVGIIAVWLVILAIVFTAGTDTVNTFIYFDF